MFIKGIESSQVCLAVLAHEIEVLKYWIEVGGELNVQKEFEQSIELGFFEGVKYLETMVPPASGSRLPDSRVLVFLPQE